MVYPVGGCCQASPLDVVWRTKPVRMSPTPAPALLQTLNPDHCPPPTPALAYTAPPTPSHPPRHPPHHTLLRICHDQIETVHSPTPPTTRQLQQAEGEARAAQREAAAATAALRSAEARTQAAEAREARMVAEMREMEVGWGGWGRVLSAVCLESCIYIYIYYRREHWAYIESWAWAWGCCVAGRWNGGGVVGMVYVCVCGCVQVSPRKAGWLDCVQHAVRLCAMTDGCVEPPAVECGCDCHVDGTYHASCMRTRANLCGEFSCG